MLAFAAQASKSLQQGFKSLEPIFTMLSNLRGAGASYSNVSPHRTAAVNSGSWRQFMAFGREKMTVSNRGGQLCSSGALLPAPNCPNKAPFVLGLARAGFVAYSLANEDSLGAAYSVSAEDVASSSSNTRTFSSSLQGSSGATSTSAALALTSGSFVLPHPDKMAKGGEDWFFIAQNRRAIGVADGVGGWSEIGVDAGLYARQLMNAALASADSVQSVNDLSPQTILEEAYTKTDARGSCTACIAVLLPPSSSDAGSGVARLRVANLGDSGALVLRAGKVVFHSPQQQHGFNFPFQIGSADSMSDLPQAAEQFEVNVQAGDVVVLGTDGLWDNCFDEEVASVIKYCQEHGMSQDKTAQVMAHYARHRAADSKFASPFAYAAFQAGYAYMGGKMDDITVVVALVDDSLTAQHGTTTVPAGAAAPIPVAAKL